MNAKKFFMPIVLILALSVSACKKNGSGDAASIRFVSNGNLIIPYTETTDTLYYEVNNPADGAEIKPEAESDWITGLDASVEGALIFTALENPLKETRSTIITVNYLYDGGQASAQINVIQDPSNAIVYEAACASGFYYGDTYGTPGMRYYTWLSDSPVQGSGLGEGTNYCLDIFAGEPENMQAIAAAPGTYTFSSSGQEGTLGSNNCRLVDGTTGETTAFRSGTLVITKEGDGYHYEAKLTDSSGVEHRVTYTGEVSLFDTTNPYVSTLDGDYEVQLDGAGLYSYFYGTYYNDYTMNWSGTIAHNSGNGDAIQFDLCAPLSFDYEAGFPTGTFNIDGTMGEYTTINGFQDNTGMAIGTWYYEMKNQNMGTRVAPLVSGTLEIKKNGAEYSLELDAKDDAGNKVTANWTGAVYTSDQSTDGMAMKKTAKSAFNAEPAF